MGCAYCITQQPKAVVNLGTRSRFVQYIQIDIQLNMFCFVSLWSYYQFLVNSCDNFIDILCGYFTSTGTIMQLPQCQWSSHEGYRWNWPVSNNNKNTNKQVPTLQYIPRNMHTVFALLCFVVAIHWLIFPYPSGLLHLHCGNLAIAPVPAKQPWWIWINTSCEFIMNDCITTTKQSTTKPCAYFLGYTVKSLI